MTVPVVIADLVVRNPCRFIEEGSWQWWASGCFIFSAEAVVLAASRLAAWLLMRALRGAVRRSHA